jgi:hypothetical protein
MFITVFDVLKKFGFHEESYRLEQGTYTCNFLFDPFEGYLGLESVSVENKSVMFDEFLKLGNAIKFDHEWKYLKCSSKISSDLILKTIKFLIDSTIPSQRKLEFEWHLLLADNQWATKMRWATTTDVMNFDFDSTYILLNYHIDANYMSLTRQDIFSKKLKEVRNRPLTIEDFSFEEIISFRLTIFSRPKLIEIEDRSMYKNAQVKKP